MPCRVRGALKINPQSLANHRRSGLGGLGPSRVSLLAKSRRPSLAGSNRPGSLRLSCSFARKRRSQGYPGHGPRRSSLRNVARMRQAVREGRRWRDLKRRPAGDVDSATSVTPAESFLPTPTGAERPVLSVLRPPRLSDQGFPGRPCAHKDRRSKSNLRSASP